MKWLIGCLIGFILGISAAIAVTNKTAPVDYGYKDPIDQLVSKSQDNLVKSISVNQAADKTVSKKVANTIQKINVLENIIKKYETTNTKADTIIVSYYFTEFDSTISN